MKRALALFVLLGFCNSLHAADAVLKNITGTVTVRHPGEKTARTVKAGQELRRNDRVTLGAGAAAQVVFKSGAVLLVKEKSKFSIKSDKKGTLVAFDIGEFLIGLKHKLQGDQRFRVRTPAAVAAVRGTVFWGKTDEEKKCQYACFTGSIELWAQEKMVKLMPGEYTTISFGQAPAGPTTSTISPDYIQTFAVEGSLEGVDELIKTEKP